MSRVRLEGGIDLYIMNQYWRIGKAVSEEKSQRYRAGMAGFR